MLPQLHFDYQFIQSGSVRDIIIGTADGLTVPFVLASGVSGAIDSAHIVVTAGLAQIVAGALAMSLSGYIAATDEAERYEREILREDLPPAKAPGSAATPILDLLKSYGVTEGGAALVAAVTGPRSVSAK